ncbi:hypothetical protein BKA93DRAFT_828218 [Sparassis latifolia]
MLGAAFAFSRTTLLALTTNETGTYGLRRFIRASWCGLRYRWEEEGTMKMVTADSDVLLCGLNECTFLHARFDFCITIKPLRSSWTAARVTKDGNPDSRKVSAPCGTWSMGQAFAVGDSSPPQPVRRHVLSDEPTECLCRVEIEPVEKR